MDLIAGKNSTWLNPPHVGGIVDTEGASCRTRHCDGAYEELLVACPVLLCQFDYCADEEP